MPSMPGGATIPAPSPLPPLSNPLAPPPVVSADTPTMMNTSLPGVNDTMASIAMTSAPLAAALDITTTQQQQQQITTGSQINDVTQQSATLDSQAPAPAVASTS